MEINYKITHSQLLALRAASQGCTQLVTRTCDNSPHFVSNSAIVSWVSLDGTKRENWGGVEMGDNGCKCKGGKCKLHKLDM